MASEFKSVEDRLKERLERDGIFTYPLSVPINAPDRDAIAHAADIIRGSMEYDECTCDESHPEAGPCDYCERQQSLKKLEAILIPEHRSLHPDRAQSAPEAIYLREWQKEQERIGWLNHGYGTLELLLMPTRQTFGPYQSLGYVPPMSQRDAEVAATVIQWLGTNCGRCFIEKCEKQITEARAQRTDYENGHSRAMFKPTEVLPIAENLANEVCLHFHRPDGVNFVKLKTRVQGAIEAATMKIRGLFSKLARDVRALIKESDGVAGLHKNGDMAEWESVLAGGRFEEWLSSLNDAEAFLDPKKDVPDAANELPVDHPPVPGGNQAGHPAAGVAETETRSGADGG